MKKKSTSLFTIFISFALIVSVIFAARNYFMGRNYRRNLEYSYLRALGELSESLDDMTLALSKSEYCTTATLQLELASGIISSGNTAKSAAGALPFSQDKAAAIEKLISGCQDYSLFAAKKIAAGETFSNEDHETLSVMAEYTGRLLEGVDNIRIELEETEGSISKTERLLANIDVPAKNFDDSLSDAAEAMNSFPVLLYDGPFSDHITAMEPVFLEGKKEVSRDEAIRIAADFLDIDTDGLSCDHVTEGAMAVYQVRGSSISVNVTKRGGVVSWAKLSAEVPDGRMGYEEALDFAEEFLEDAGLTDMVESYFSIADNTCTINFSAEQDDVILYPDLVKVTVELNQGGVLEYNAEGYIMNHRERTDLTPKISEAEARSKISPKLKIKETELALIPTPGKYEVLCYEFLCETEDSTEVLVYINSETGYEQQVFILRETEAGTLAA